MEVKLNDIVESREALNRLFSSRARAKENFTLALIRRKIDPIIKEFDEARLGAFKEHGHRDLAQPNSWNFWEVVEVDGKEKREFDHAAFDACDGEIQELLDDTVDVDFDVDIATIDKAKIDPPLTPDELASLWWLIKEFRETEEA